MWNAWKAKLLDDLFQATRARLASASGAPTLADLPDCLALLVPDASQSFETVFAHAMWLKTWFQGRAGMALSLADRAYVLETGNIVATGTGAELLADDTIKEAYLGVVS